MFSSAEYSVCRAVWNSLVGLNTALALRAAPRVVACEQGLEFADDLLGGGFWDQVAFDLELEALLEERGSVDPHPSRSGVPQKVAAEEAQSVSTDPIGFGSRRSRAGWLHHR